MARMATPRLSRDRIIQASLEVAGDRGIQRVTMRAVADRLQVVPMALYRHVPDRQAMIEATVDAIGALVTVEEMPDEAWAAGIRRWALAHRAALAAYPGTAEWLIAHGPAGPHAFRIADGYAAHLLAAGLTPHEAARAFITVVTWVLARCATEDHWRAAQRDREGATRRAEFALGFQADEDRAYPAAAAIARDFASLSVDDAFEAGLELVLQGVQSLSDRSTGIVSQR